MGQDTRSIFQYLKDDGYNFLIGGFHVKGQVIDAKGVSAWGYGGQTVRARRLRSTASRRRSPPDQVNAWKKQTVLCRARAARHGPPRSARLPAEPYGGLARPPARRARAAAARRRQHAPGRRARIPEGARCRTRSGRRRSSQGSIAFVRRIDEAAACMYALQHEVLAAQGIDAQGTGREAYRT